MTKSNTLNKSKFSQAHLILNIRNNCVSAVLKNESIKRETIRNFEESEEF